MEKKTLGSFLAALRRANGLTQRELADKLCVSDKAVSRWERDEAMPDLSLIPVIAEIFNVTCDELLRGQRIDRDAQSPEKATAQTEKQIRNLIAVAKTRYQINCIISLGLGFVGLFMALLINFGFLRAYIGFWAGCVLFASAILCQIVFLIQGKARLHNSEVPLEDAQSYSAWISALSRRIITAIIALLSSTLPLLTVNDTYWGLPWDRWLPEGIACAGVAAALCWLFGVLIRYIRRRREGLSLSKLEIFMLKRIAVMLLIPTLTFLAAFGISRIDRAQFIETQTFESWEAFEEAISTPMTRDEKPLKLEEVRFDEDDIYPDCTSYCILLDEEGNEHRMPYPQPEKIGPEGKTLCTYRQWNMSIAGFSPNHDNQKDLLPVTYYTWNAYNKVDIVFQAVTVAILAAGLVLTLTVILRTAKAAKKLKHDDPKDI